MTVIRTVEGKDITLDKQTCLRTDNLKIVLTIICSFLISFVIVSSIGGVTEGKVDISFFAIFIIGVLFSFFGLLSLTLTELLFTEEETFCVSGEGSNSEWIDKTGNGSIDTLNVCNAANRIEVKMKEYIKEQNEKEIECQRIARKCK